MPILDRYLLHRFTHAFAICFASLVGLYVVMDAFANIDEFGRDGEGTLEVLVQMAQYYGYRTTTVFDRLSGHIAMLAAMFTLTWVRRSGELVAVLAAGIPVRRVVLPVASASVAVSVLAIVNQEWIIPALREELQRDVKDEDDGGQDAESAYDYATNILVQGTRVFPEEERLHDAHFLLPDDVLGVLLNVHAEDAYYVREGPNGRPGWRLVDVDPQFDDLPTVAQEALPNQDLILQHEGGYFIACGVTVAQLVTNQRFYEFMSTAEIVEQLHNPSVGVGADQFVYLHNRLLRPLQNLVLLLLALPYVLGGESRNIFVSMGICMAVSGAFMGVSQLCIYLGRGSHLSPAFAAWLPVILFGTLAVYELRRVRT